VPAIAPRSTKAKPRLKPNARPKTAKKQSEADPPAPRKEPVVVAVGSTRRPKLAAVRAALDVCGPAIHSDAIFDIVPVDAPSGVRHTPLSREETMTGARNRAQSLLRMAREKREQWSYFVGLEGGLDIFEHGGRRWVFLENWAYVCDREGREAFGQSGAILLPDVLVTLVVEQGIELAEAIDEFAGRRGVRDAQGAWGVLTGNRITREDAFRVALLNAFAPFFVAPAR
jgi:non-canonical (house-cleaning) NTP pyrophosphatase